MGMMCDDDAEDDAFKHIESMNRVKKDRIDKFLQDEDYRAMYLKVRDELAKLQQRTWVGLTDDEQQQAYEQWQNDGWGVFYNAIETKLKEKNS